MIRIIGLTLILSVFALSACSRVEGDWQAAVEENTVEAYEAHLAEFPETPHAAEARSAITELEWQAADAAGSIDAIEEFMAAHPDAPQLAAARARLADLYAAMQEADLADMGEKLRAFLDGDESSNVIAMIGGQEFVPRQKQPQSNIVVHGGSKMMAVIGGAARVVYTAGDNNTIAAVDEFEFAIGAPIEMTNGNRYTWREGGWETTQVDDAD